MPKIYIASDHAGFALKTVLINELRTSSYEVDDVGDTVMDPEDDYPDFITPCAMKVAADNSSFGIIIGGSGQGEAMAANRLGGVRTAVFYGNALHPQTDKGGRVLDIVTSARMHNDANILSLGACFITEEQAKEAVKLFLETAFSSEERHRRRIAKF